MPTSVCPVCDEKVYVDANLVQGETVSCDECGSDLELVGLDPIELDPFGEDDFGFDDDDSDDFMDDDDDFDDDDDDDFSF